MYAKLNTFVNMHYVIRVMQIWLVRNTESLINLTDFQTLQISNVGLQQYMTTLKCYATENTANNSNLLPYNLLDYDFTGEKTQNIRRFICEHDRWIS